MVEVQQVAAIKSVFDQNPLSPVLAFYAGLTGLAVGGVRDILFRVLESPYDISNIVKELGLDSTNPVHKSNPSCDPRRQLLALMNCIYETQNPDLFLSLIHI